ncbi:bifunctional 2-polyprenyl-6-hydroxyphenol methylase/3-demethylubiquinol 3-O-methyltransferase UbiG [Kineococcus gypseus]|uniref:bifunctional 2-polyprenyl-6-hydroxyphenol methylase/3-demethylubiquinol 3-O-methyltransferase UbiG n=1 Tax=Kineococcus gypseus TaxID=1637102 RepID=UPI003D7DEDB3
MVPGAVLGVDNDVYDRHASSWWDEDDPLNMLHGSVTPARFEYFRSVLTQRLGRDPAGARALDIGCGGGFLAEEFARLGCAVVGVDPSAASLATAREHAAASGLAIDYRVGRGEDLPVEDHAFDVVYCCDVFEHVDDLERVVAETARALAPDGVYFFDTVNRTRASRLLAIRVLQEWRWTRVFDTPVHRWSMFITPGELAALLGRHGLLLREVVGMGPRVKNPLTALRGLRDAQRGRTSYGELSRLLDFGATKTLSMSYMGTPPSGVPPAGEARRRVRLGGG